MAFLSNLISRDFLWQMYAIFITVFEYLICAVIYSIPYEKKKNLVPRLLLSLFTVFAVCMVLVILRADLNSIYTRFISGLLIYFITLPCLFLCLEESSYSVIMCWCSVTASVQIGSSAFSVFMAFFGMDGISSISFFPDYVIWRDWGIFYGFRLLVYGACFWIFGRNTKMEEDLTLVRSITPLAVLYPVTMSILTTFTGEYRGDSFVLYIVIQVLSISYALMVLVLRYALLDSRRYRQELSIMEEIIDKEKKQYDSIRDNIDVINMKCHDLKHQLAKFQGKLTDQEIASLQEAITIYDRNIKTGNEALDVILCEKMLVCQKEDILMTCLADGEALSFMSVSHIYSLFSNAIDNAIEAVRHVSNPEKRVLNISVRRENGVTVEVINTFEGDLRIVDGLPETTKEDKNHHGFGVKSMRYIAEQYGGTLSAETEGDLFTLTVNFP